MKPTGTYTTKYLQVIEDIVPVLLEEGAAVKVEPFEDLYTVRWWNDTDSDQ